MAKVVDAVKQAIEMGKNIQKQIQPAMTYSDNYINSFAQLDLINDKLQTTEQLQEKIFASAERAGSSYYDMAKAVSQIGMAGEDAFKSNDEMIAFTELVRKSVLMSGGGAKEQQATIQVLSQGMGMGKLQGDDFKTIMTNAPLMAKAISEATGKSMVDLKKMTAEGSLTADILKSSMFVTADSINQKFDSLPTTFGDITTEIKNSMLESFGPVAMQISGMLNGKGVEAFVGGLGNALSFTAGILEDLLIDVGNLGEFFYQNWTTIEPLVLGIVSAFTLWKLSSYAVALAQVINAFATGSGTIAIFAQTLAVSGLTAAWGTLNTAMKANVIFLIVALVVGLIVAIINLWNTNDSFAAGFMRMWNGLLNFFDQIPIFFTRVGLSIVNGFMWVKLKSKEIMNDLINGVIDGINKMITGIKELPGIGKLLDNLEIGLIDHVDLVSDAATLAEGTELLGNAMLKQLEENAAQKAAEREQSVQNMLNDRASKRAQEEAEKQAKKAKEPKYPYEPPGSTDDDSKKYPKNPPASNAATDYAASMPNSLSNINKVNEVGAINDTVEVSGEDLATMRELAEMKNIQNFVQMTPSVNVQTGDIRQESDINTIVARIEQVLTEQIVSSAQGVYGT